MMGARTRAEWLDRMRAANVLEVATALGLESRAPRGANGGVVYGCPACGAERRHTRTADRRGSVGIASNGRGWQCFQCDARGDATDFVSYTLRSKRFGELDNAARVEVREWCQRWLGLGSSNGSRPVPPSATRSEPLPTYPPAGEVAALWGACGPVLDVSCVRDWLVAKHIDPIAVADADLARALPDGVALPSWAALGARSWLVSGHRLVVPMVDARGVMRSVLARKVIDVDGPKSVAPSGYGRGGLVLACGLGRQVLAAGKLPEWWGDTALRIEVCEGEKKFLMRTARFGDANEYAPAVIGIESGSWTSEHAARIPDSSGIYIATDPDEAGARYATTIIQSLEQRVRSKAVRVELRDGLTFQSEGRIEVKVRSAV